MEKPHKIEIRIRTANWFENPKVARLVYEKNKNKPAYEIHKPIKEWQQKIEI